MIRLLEDRDRAPEGTDEVVSSVPGSRVCRGAGFAPASPATLDAALRGEEWAWSLLYRDLAPCVRGYFRAHRARCPDDLTGDVFLEVASRIGRFTGGPGAFRAWVFTIAHSRLVDEARRASHRGSETVLSAEVPAGDDVEGEVMDRLRSEELLGAVDSLPPDRREVVLLRVFGQLSVAEVAEVLHKSQTAVKVLQHRAVRSLQANLGAGDVTKSAAERLPD